MIFPQKGFLRQAQAWLHRLVHEFWKRFLVFLEIIGLKKEPGPDPESQVARFRLYHAEFRKLLAANNSFLETVSEFGQKLINREYLDRSYVERKAVRSITEIHSMVESLNVISSERYASLRPAFDRIAASLTQVVAEDSAETSPELVKDLPLIRAIHADLVGGKMANLGEMRNVLDLPVPDGFAVTTEAFRLVLQEGGILSWIQSEQVDLLSSNEVERASRELRKRILTAAIPLSLESQILEAYDRLAARTVPNPRVAARSSALGEDSDLSFAGQYHSALNVSREGLIDAYREVLASLYSPEALHYRIAHGILGESVEMAVGVIVMVDAVASGVVFSREPGRPDSGRVLVQAVQGLGVSLVEGGGPGEVLLVPREGSTGSIERQVSIQTTGVIAAEGGGVRESVLSSGEAQRTCLTDPEAFRLGQWAVLLESHFRAPQDVEWALSPESKLYLLQSRPLRLSLVPTRTEDPIPGYPVLVRGGDAACGGVGIGVAVHADENDPVDAFPDGGVLIARRSSPKFVRFMTKTRAIVTDAGSTTGHMASLARELRVPALLNTHTATLSIPNGAIITVDAASGFVYQGEVPALAEQARSSGSLRPEPEQRGRSTPEIRFLEKVVKLISPLNLTDPRSASFSADQCRTLHDLARFIHEKSYAEMFAMGGKLGDVRSSSYHLDVFLPIDLYIVDLGGGLTETGNDKRKVKISQIASVPLSALLKGMLNEDLPRFGPRPIDLGGFVSVMMRHAATNPEADQTFWDPCYAMISDCYLNYTARVGYHFSVVDAYCSEKANKNYINFLFRGGAADSVRRNRRAKAIVGILRKKGFSAELNQDSVNARLNKATRQESIVALEMIGTLFQFFRQMDAAMTSEDAVGLIVDAFLRGDYGLKNLTGHGSS